MYVPRPFQEERVEVMHDFIQCHPLGALVLVTPAGIEANHLPFELEVGAGPMGTLRCHVARANPVWRECGSAREALVIFSGPQGYVSPSWYPSKMEHGKVVPTWNYVAVHAYGPVMVMEDKDWLRALVERMTRRHEAGREHPWSVTDAPQDFIEDQLSRIVGLEIQIQRMLAKAKAGQNRPEADRAGAAQGLAAQGGQEASQAMAARMRQRP